MIGLRPTDGCASRALLLVTWTLAFLACREESASTVEQVRIDLVDLLPAAEVAGKVEPLDGDSPSALRLYADSDVTYHFAVPAGARLVGEVIGSRDSLVQVFVETTDESGDRHSLLDAAIEDASRPLDADLSAYAGQLLRLRISVRGGAPGGAHVDWQDLRIEGTRSRPSFEAPRSRHNVLLILFDSLRADQTAPYGGSATQTPRFERFANEGVTFVEARSSSSWTRPAVATMLTSVEPSVHGILSYDAKLGSAVPYLPEILQRNGYRTLVVTKNLMVSRTFGFFRGFDEAHEIYWKLESGQLDSDPERQAEQIWSRYVEAAVDASGSRPFFVYLHEFDPHSPYDPPEPYDSLYDFGYQGSVESTVEDILAMRLRPDEVHPDDVRHLESLYRGEVAFMDRYLGGILDALTARGLAESTLVILVSDHGESRSIGHGHTLYEEQLRIPFLMRLPGVLPAGRRVASNVGLVDLPPTVLDLLGFDVPDGMQGESLLGHLVSPEKDLPLRASFGTSAFDSESVVFGRWKLIRDEGKDPPKVTLFDIEKDPRESVNLADDHPVVVGALEQMRRWQLEIAKRSGIPHEAIDARDVPKRVRQKLEALGYVEEKL